MVSFTWALAAEKLGAGTAARSIAPLITTPYLVKNYLMRKTVILHFAAQQNRASNRRTIVLAVIHRTVVGVGRCLNEYLLRVSRIYGRA
jgi:hypothetical protein